GQDIAQQSLGGVLDPAGIRVDLLVFKGGNGFKAAGFVKGEGFRGGRSLVNGQNLHASLPAMSWAAATPCSQHSPDVLSGTETFPALENFSEGRPVGINAVSGLKSPVKITPSQAMRSRLPRRSIPTAST